MDPDGRAIARAWAQHWGAEWHEDKQATPSGSVVVGAAGAARTGTEVFFAAPPLRPQRHPWLEELNERNPRDQPIKEAWLRLLAKATDAKAASALIALIADDYFEDDPRFRQDAVAAHPQVVACLNVYERSEQEIEHEYGGALWKAAMHRSLDQFPLKARTLDVCVICLERDAESGRLARNEGDIRLVPEEWKALPCGERSVWRDLAYTGARLPQLPPHAREDPDVIDEFAYCGDSTLAEVDVAKLERRRPGFYRELCEREVGVTPRLVEFVQGAQAWVQDLWIAAATKDIQILFKIGKSALTPAQKGSVYANALSSCRRELLEKVLLALASPRRCSTIADSFPGRESKGESQDHGQPPQGRKRGRDDKGQGPRGERAKGVRVDSSNARAVPRKRPADKQTPV